TATTRRLQRARRHCDLDEATVRDALVDLGDRILGVFLRNADRGAKARFRACELVDLPVVYRAAQSRAKLKIERHAAGSQRLQNAEIDVALIEQLFAQKVEI